MLSETELKRIRQIVSDPRQMIPMFSFDDEKGKRNRLDQPFAEQRLIVKDRIAFRRNAFLKPRQIGCGTATQAYDFWYAYRCPDPINTLVVADEYGATRRHLMRYRDYHRLLPDGFHLPVVRDNENELVLAIGSKRETTFRAITAGGKSAGKGFTFQRFHGTECAFWDDAARIWSSLDATLHEGEHLSITMESTSAGPTGWWPDFFYACLRDEEWNARFFKWSQHKSYTVQLNEQESKRVLDTLTEEEHQLMLTDNLTLGQILWRRGKVTKSGLIEFQRNYPLTVEEAFASGGESYFPADWLEVLAKEIRKKNAGSADGRTEWVEEITFAEPETGQRYAIGVDVASGSAMQGTAIRSRKDYSVIQVLNERMEQVYRWSSKILTPTQLGRRVADVGAKYNMAKVLVESNNHGHVTLNELRRLGYPNLFKVVSPDGKTTKDWQTNVKTKREACEYAREMMLRHAVGLRDLTTITELQGMVEPEDGDLPRGADGKHDDHAIALVLALQAGKHFVNFQEAKKSPIDVLLQRFAAKQTAFPALSIAVQR